jgi:uncharacterized protein YjiS (DUF1127 family)
MKHIEAGRWAAAPPAIDDFGYLEPVLERDRTGLVSRALAALPVWLDRTRRRRELARIGARDLKDAGLSLEAVEHEIGRPFWRPLDRERK